MRYMNTNTKIFNKPIWIHIGMPKCASTSLQKGFFSACPEIDFIGRNDNATGRTSRHGPLLALASLDEMGYQEKKDSIREMLFNSFIEDDDVRVHVLSDEVIGSAYRPYIQTIPVADIHQSATRLKELFPEANILMIIRNQKKLLTSWFPQLMRNIGSQFDVHECFKMHQEYFELGQGSSFYQMDYNRVYNLYADLFGKDKVHVVCLEDMAKDQDGSLQKIIEMMGLSDDILSSNFMQKQENTRAMQGEFRNNAIYDMLGRIFSFLPPKIKHKIRGKTFGKPIEINFSEAELDFIEKIYGPGNMKLETATGLNLKEKGYPLGN